MSVLVIKVSSNYTFVLLSTKQFSPYKNKKAIYVELI